MPSSIAEQIRQLAAKLDAFEQLVKKRTAETLAMHAELVAAEARALAPVDTGELRDSIEVVKVDDLHYQVVATAPYAADVELGTAHQAAQPFLHPAYDANRASLPASLAQGLKNA